jgi:hypothetical protein
MNLAPRPPLAPACRLPTPHTTKRHIRPERHQTRTHRHIQSHGGPTLVRDYTLAQGSGEAAATGAEKLSDASQPHLPPRREARGRAGEA